MFSVVCFSQNYSNISTDSILALAKSYSKTNNDSALYFADIAHKNALKTTVLDDIANTAYHKSTYLIAKKKFDDALGLLQFNLDNANSLSTKQVGNTYLNLGAIYYLKEEWDVALEHYFNAISYFEPINYKRGLAKANLQIGVIYEKRNQMEVANFFYDKSLSFTPSNNSNHSSENLPSEISFERKIEMSLKMLESIREKDNPKLASIVHYNLSMAYTGLNQHQKAIEAASRSLNIKKKIGFEENLDVNYALIGKAFLRLRNYSQAFIYLEKAQNISTKRHLKTNIYNYLIEGYSNSGNYKKALALSNEFSAFKDSINTMKENERIAEITAKYEHEKQEKEILRLQQENQEKELAIAYESTNRWRFALISLVLLSLLIWFISLYRNSLRHNREIKAEKELIAQKVERTYVILNNKTKVYLDELNYIQSDGNYLSFFINDATIIDRNRLKVMLDQLPPNFVRVHRSFIVNTNLITSINSTSLLLNRTITIPVSRTFKSNISQFK